jgi:thioredoxin reductase (NADPH)
MHSQLRASGAPWPFTSTLPSERNDHESCFGRMLKRTPTDVDVAVVGGGPAGLTAAIYLARFRRTVTVFDAGDGRATHIPVSHNVPGFPEGISGKRLLKRLRQQASTYDVDINNTCVERVEIEDPGFRLMTVDGVTSFASRVILATGIVDLAPKIRGLHEAIRIGLVRLCPVCDAFEATGKVIGVAGPDDEALAEACFLRTYSDRVAILSNHSSLVSSAVRTRAKSAGIEVWDDVCDLSPFGTALAVTNAEGATRYIDVLYPAMGCRVRSELAYGLGAKCDDKGCIIVDEHLKTSIDGVYAIGDVTPALNQVAVAFGQAAVAATAVHNSLRQSDFATS